MQIWWRKGEVEMDKETFEKIEQKKAHFLLALEEFDGGTLDVDEMKEDYESLFQIIKEQQQEIERQQIKLNSIRFYVESPITDNSELVEQIREVLNNEEHDGI